MLEGIPGRNETAIMIAATTGNVDMVQLVVRLLVEAWAPSIEEVIALFRANPAPIVVQVPLPEHRR